MSDSTLTFDTFPFRVNNFNGDGSAYIGGQTLYDGAGVKHSKTNVVPVGGGVPVVTTATIGSGAALSGAVDLGSAILSAIQMPAAWTAAAITFDVSADNATFVTLKYQGAEVSLTVAASEGHTVDTSTFIGWRYLKVRSGTAGTPVNQGGARTITLIGTP